MAKRTMSRVAMLCVMAAVSGALVFGIAGASSATTTAKAPKATVKIQNFVFKPAKITVAKGTKVTWKNFDDTGHNVTFSKFGSPTLGAGMTWSHKFTKAGTFKYMCTLHPGMFGTVVVTG